MKSTQDILFEEISGRGGNLGVITLNRPQALNALNLTMLHQMNYHLTEWGSAEQIKAVIIRAAEGRAFCAGGDIRAVYEKKMNQDKSISYFFRDEYQVNLKIFHYPKPYIALLDGITMGGGAGISINGSHRIGTERLLFSMPETSIGFYPDVGATFFLSRLPHFMGVYLGLTSARISYQDCAAVGLVDFIVPQEKFAKLIYSLADTNMQENAREEVSQVIQQYAVPYTQSTLMNHQSDIATCFSKNTIEEIYFALENRSTEWAMQTLATLKSKSPLSLKVTLRALTLAKNLNFNECMRMEYRITSRFAAGAEFYEGIRAAIIDKDQSPKWQYTHIENVPDDVVDVYFSELEQELI